MIEIVEYRPSWRAEFEEIAATLRRGIGDAALRIDHIGSTSIPHLCAKDVIDVQVTVARLDATLADRIAALGFIRYAEAKLDHIPPGYPSTESEWTKILFVQPHGQRRMHVHVREAGRQNQRFALLVRDFLTAHPHFAQAYGELKRRLAVALAQDSAYPDVKDPAVDLIYLAAEEWATRSNWAQSPNQL